MDIEIQFLHEAFPGKGPKLLVDHIRRMGSGEAPFFSKTLSLVYDKLVEKTVAPPVPSGSGLGKSIEIQETVVDNTPPQASTFTLPTSSSSGTAPSSSQPPIPIPAPASRPVSSLDERSVWLVCYQCGEPASLEELYGGLRCPTCPSRGPKKGRPYMKCQLCDAGRPERRDRCMRKACQVKFR